jgi:hypothetical protein
MFIYGETHSVGVKLAIHEDKMAQSQAGSTSNQATTGQGRLVEGSLW